MVLNVAPAESDMPYKVLIVDDHPLVRDGLCGLLALLPGGAQLYTAGSAAQALEQAECHAPLDIVLLDYNLPDGRAEDLIPALKARGGAPILVVSAAEDNATVASVMQCGASGFLAKSKASASILEAVKQVLAGRVFNSSANLGSEHATAAVRPVLSARMLDVLFMLDQGLTNKQIALQLGTAEKTVKNHVGLLFVQLGTANRLQAIRKARDLGILK
jgi:DNA-binding NarL/FixJ family response regulator